MNYLFPHIQKKVNMNKINLICLIYSQISMSVPVYRVRMVEPAQMKSMGISVLVRQAGQDLIVKQVRR